MENNKPDENVKEENIAEETQDEEVEINSELTIEQLVKKAEKADEMTDKFLRLTAEFDNFRKRTQKEKDALYADGIAAAAERFIPLIDNMERAIEAVGDDENVQGLKKGFELIFQQLKDILKSMNIEEIPALGEEFNPELHEAVMHIEDDKVDTNTIVEQFQKGYIMNGKVLRHSVVKVAN